VPALRSSEKLVVAYFVYVAVIAPFFNLRWWRAWVMVAGVIAVLLVISRIEKLAQVRDWLPLGAALIAFKQMDWFTRATDHHLENAWVQWDHLLLSHGRGWIEAPGVWLPGLFELCYVLVYAVAPVSVLLILNGGQREHLNRFWLAYLAGTLSVYALFPYFPSQPPRILFPADDVPHVITALRRFNLFILGRYSIHSSVFPSAHVSSVFSAAWGLLATISQRPLIGWTMAAYGVCVAIAIVYGRYHYGIDAVAGFGMSLVALGVLKLTK
jgi:membrane-associated phospholipid phosphatase